MQKTASCIKEPDHHLFVTGIEGVEHEYRFEVRRTAPGSDHLETIYKKRKTFMLTTRN